MIARLEHAGLGYHVKTDEARDRMGDIPMRHLVYRVQPLPKSLIPLVWDFGTLSNEVEEIYIRQMVQKCALVRSNPNLFWNTCIYTHQFYRCFHEYR